MYTLCGMAYTIGLLASRSFLVVILQGFVKIETAKLGGFFMSSRRFIFLTVILFFLGALPLLIGQPSATASAGLSLGFSAPLEQIAMLLVLAVVGVCAALLPRDGLLLMPMALILMMMVGGVLMLDVAAHPALRYFIFGAILCMGLLIGLARDKFTVLTLLILASLGYHFGGFFMQSVPVIGALVLTIECGFRRSARPSDRSVSMPASNDYLTV